VVISEPLLEVNWTEQERSWPETVGLSCRNGADLEQTVFAQPAALRYRGAMPNHPSPIALSAARRARWLGELAQALDQANRLLFRLREVEQSSSEASNLHARILALRAEINAIRRGGRRGSEVFRPKRMN
jgi:hypothetical protein